MFEEISFKAANRKTAVELKEFNYADVKAADYSYSKKPLFPPAERLPLLFFWVFCHFRFCL